MRGDQRWDETWHRLREWTNGQAPAERLAAQILLSDGFTGLDPTHPLGGKDAGADALAERDGKPWVMAVYFPRGQETLKAITDKFKADLPGVAGNDADAVAFVTNQELRRAERRDLAKAVDKPVRIYHLERLVAILDQPKMYGVRRQFLGIEPPVPGELDAVERLAELRRASIARCVARWLAVGLPVDDAQPLADDPSLGAPADHLVPTPEAPVAVWTAPMGSGKSIAAERLHQADIEAATRDQPAPAPAFLAADAAVPALEKAVKHATEEICDPRRQGARIIVDGVDELGYQAAGDLLMQARVLARTWPNTTVLLTSRPMPVLQEAPEHQQLPPLDLRAQEECVEIGAQEQLRLAALHTLPDPIKATLPQPLFALLTGVWMREHSSMPRAPVDLLAMLGERATRKLGVEQADLRALAVRSVKRELGPVAKADVLGGTDIGPLLGTGMVADRAGGLVFGLPAIAQWFAAQALLLGEETTEDLLSAPEDLELWRYALGMAVALGSADQVERLLVPLLEGQAGFALRVLDAAFGQAVLGGASPPPWREGGTQVRHALQRLADSFGPLAPMVAETDDSGRVLPMAVASGEHHLTIAFYQGADPRADVFALPEDFDLPAAGRWGRVRSAQVGPGAAWALGWAMTGIRHRLDALLRQRLLPIAPVGPLADEEAWACALDLAGENALTRATLEIDPLLSAINSMLEDSGGAEVIFKRPGRPGHELRGAKRYLERLREGGQAKLTAPLPPPDQSSGGSIGDFYTDERLLEIAIVMYEQAVVAYRQITEQWMPTLRSQMEHQVLMPVRVVGYITTGTEEEHAFGSIPMMAGYLEALREGRDDEVVMHVSEAFDYRVGDDVYAQQRAARPHAARWLTGTIGGMPFEVGDRYPVADVVYDWLAHDLARLGLVKTLAARRSGNTAVRWDVTHEG